MLACCQHVQVLSLQYNCGGKLAHHCPIKCKFCRKACMYMCRAIHINSSVLSISSSFDVADSIFFLKCCVCFW